MSPPGGIYVHLPYCAVRCHYCTFVMSTDDSSRETYLAAVRQEIGLVASEAFDAAFDTVYFGGGTPSYLPAGEIPALLAELRQRLQILPDGEVTIEANPDDVTPERLERWKGVRVTRVSLGVQSLVDTELAEIGRLHDAATARRARERLLRAGFDVSCDLLLGLPYQTASSFLQGVSEMAASGVGHLSIYLLEWEKAKAIASDHRHHPENYLSDDEQADLWQEASAILLSHGFIHYEISNWACPGKEARHNMKYWLRVPTLGLGVSAHEFWRSRRRANTAQLPTYIARLAGGERPRATDRPIDAGEALREQIVLGLRLRRGVEQQRIEQWLALAGDDELPGDLRRFEEAGLLDRRQGRLALTERGFLVSNEILCRFV